MRCLTLLAVDDTIAELSDALDELQVSDHTYFIYSSDRKSHRDASVPTDTRVIFADSSLQLAVVSTDGYNLGHHRLPDNKFNSYLHD